MKLHPAIEKLLEERHAEEAARAQAEAEERRREGLRLLDEAVKRAPVLRALLEGGALTYNAETRMLHGEGLAPIWVTRDAAGRVGFCAGHRSDEEWAEGDWAFSLFSVTGDIVAAISEAVEGEPDTVAEATEQSLICPILSAGAYSTECLRERCAWWANGHCAVLRKGR